MSDELLMGSSCLAALSDVGGGYYPLTQGEVFTVHLSNMQLYKMALMFLGSTCE